MVLILLQWVFRGITWFHCVLLGFTWLFYRVSLRPTRFTPNLLDITPDSTPVRSSSFPTMPIHESDWKSLTIHQKVETKEKQSSQNARFAIAVHRLVFHDVVLLCHTIPFSGRSRVVSVASTVASDPVFQQNKKKPDGRWCWLASHRPRPDQWKAGKGKKDSRWYFASEGGITRKNSTRGTLAVLPTGLNEKLRTNRVARNGEQRERWRCTFPLFLFLFWCGLSFALRRYFLS